ncbi:MAG TPA: hypothetical protein VE912_10970 [Bacteroidales bacterium]|nr:hypothetical protein [Bacteroidales bacterium]
MHKETRKFFIRELILFLFLLVAGSAVFLFTPLSESFSYAFFIPLLLIFLITTFIFNRLVKLSRENNNRFNFFFIGSTGLKLIFYLLVIIIYLLINPGQAIPFVSVFLVVYFSYTVLEIASLLKFLKKRGVYKNTL